MYNVPCPKVKRSIRSKNIPLKVECLNPGAGLQFKLRNPSDPLYRHIVSSKPDVLGLVETMSIKASKIPRLPGYKRFFCPANRTGGVPSGGVLVLYKDSLTFNISFVCKSRNVIWIRFQNNSVTWHIAFVYARTAKLRNTLEITQMYDSLSKKILEFQNLGSRVALFGDFNARLGTYTGDHTTNSSFGPFKGFQEFHDLSLLNRTYSLGKPTYVKPTPSGNSTSIIDFGLTDGLDGVLNFGVCDTVFGIDAQKAHRLIFCNLAVGVGIPENVASTENHDSSKVQWHKFTEEHLLTFRELAVKSLVPMLGRLTELIELAKSSKVTHPAKFSLNCFLKKFNNVKTTVLGKRDLQRSHKVQAKANRTLRRIQCRIDTTTAQLQHTTEPAARQRILRKVQVLEARKHRVIETHSEKQYSRFLSKLDNLDFQNRTRAFWSEVQDVLGKRSASSSSGVVNNSDGVPSNSKETFLENWASFYENLYKVDPRFEPAQRDPLEHQLGWEGPQILNLPPSLAELEFELKSAAKNKAPGPDGLRVEELAALLDSEAMPVLGKLLELFWYLGKIPSDLKTTILVPFLKNPDKNIHDPQNFRPIALTSNLLKIYQRILNRRLINFLEDGNFFSDLQFGFRSDRSVVDAHYLLREAILAKKFCTGPRGGRNVSRPLYTAMLDIRKAFDRVPRRLLWERLFNAGVSGQILKVIMDQYTDTRGVVQIDDLTTREFQIDSGVLQGSILGPVLFNVFINSLILELEHSGVGGVSLRSGRRLNVIAYADDLVLISENPADLQKLISICESWSRCNGLDFSPDKSKVLVFHPTSQSKRSKFVLNDQPLESVTSFKYLGITLDATGAVGPGLCYRTFFASSLSRAEKRLGAIQLLGARKDGLRPTTAVRLYKLLVRPILEFGAQIIPFASTQLAKFEQFQCKSLRSLLGLAKSVKAETVRLIAGVEPVECRFASLKLAYFHRLRTSSKQILKQSLADHIRHCTSTHDVTLEERNFYNSGFGSILLTICRKYNLAHEFRISSDDSRPKYSYWTKKHLREFHFARDCMAFDNTQQGALFKSVALPVLKLSKPYGGVAINPVIFEGVDRKMRFAYFQALCGTLISEHHCPAFKRRRSSSCPYCPSESRSLDHFIFDCPVFDSSRVSYFKSIKDSWQKMSLPNEPPLRSLPFLFGSAPSYPKLPKNDQRDLLHGVVRSTSRFLAQISSKLNDPDEPVQPGPAQRPPSGAT